MHSDGLSTVPALLMAVALLMAGCGPARDDLGKVEAIEDERVDALRGRDIQSREEEARLRDSAPRSADSPDAQAAGR